MTTGIGSFTFGGSVDEFLLKVKLKAGLSKDVEVARFLGLTQGAVSNWKRRGFVPDSTRLWVERVIFNSPAATDMRIGVTPVEHQLLDRLAKSRAMPLSAVVHQRRAVICIDELNSETEYPEIADAAIAAAVHLIRMAELIGGAK
jgi:hypothetical protein